MRKGQAFPVNDITSKTRVGRENFRRIGREVPPLLEAFFPQCQDASLPIFLPSIQAARQNYLGAKIVTCSIASTLSPLTSTRHVLSFQEVSHTSTSTLYLSRKRLRQALTISPRLRARPLLQVASLQHYTLRPTLAPRTLTWLHFSHPTMAHLHPHLCPGLLQVRASQRQRQR